MVTHGDEGADDGAGGGAGAAWDDEGPDRPVAMPLPEPQLLLFLITTVLADSVLRAQYEGIRSSQRMAYLAKTISSFAVEKDVQQVRVDVLVSSIVASVKGLERQQVHSLTNLKLLNDDPKAGLFIVEHISSQQLKLPDDQCANLSLCHSAAIEMEHSPNPVGINVSYISLRPLTAASAKQLCIRLSKWIQGVRVASDILDEFSFLIRHDMKPIKLALLSSRWVSPEERRSMEDQLAAKLPPSRFWVADGMVHGMDKSAMSIFLLSRAPRWAHRLGMREIKEFIAADVPCDDSVHVYDSA
jgi:hypothetical protein